MEVVQKNQSMTLYRKEDEEEFMLESMGIAYKIDDDALWFVKVPIKNGNPAQERAVMVRVEDSDPADHEEYEDEHVPREAVDNLVSWHSEIS